MKSKASAVKTGHFVLPRISALSLALSMACGAMGAQAAVDTSSWVSTKTDAFLPLVQTQDSVGTAVTANAIAVDVQQGTQTRVVVGLQLQNESQLDSFLAALHSGHAKKLTSAQFTAQYAPTQAQVDVVVTHLQKSGFKNISVAPNRLLITADGTAATVKQAFNTSIKSFTHQGRSVFANDKVAQVPAELSKIVGSVLGLQNVSTYHTLHSGFRPHTTAQSATAQAVTTQAVTGSQVAHIPTQYPGIYSVGSTPAASNAVVATIAEGSMTNVAVDFAKFLTNNPSLPALTPTYVYVGTQSTDTSGDVEWDLDTQVIYGTAGALKKMYVYVATSLTDADLATTYNRAVSDNFASIINVSLGECEAAAHTSGAQATDDTIFKAAVAQGQTFSVAAGDAGPYNCQTDSVGTPGVANTNTKRKAYDVSEPASSPYVVAVGGTGLYTTSAGAYGGEVVWNEGISATGDGTGSSRLWATGGGFSKYEARPTWQTISSSFPAGFRGVPDIAFDAASASGTNIYTDGQYGTVGGTSMAAPLFVGIWARMESAHSNSLGFPNPAFYASIPSNPTLVNDVTSGYNGWNTTYKGMVSGTGWDADTGFGSLNIANLNTFITNNTALFPKH